MEFRIFEHSVDDVEVHVFAEQNESVEFADALIIIENSLALDVFQRESLINLAYINVGMSYFNGIEDVLMYFQNLDFDFSGD